MFTADEEVNDPHRATPEVLGAMQALAGGSPYSPWQASCKPRLVTIIASGGNATREGTGVSRTAA